MEQSKLLEQKNHILFNFNFERVQAYMLLVKWQWWNSDIGDYYNPSIEQLKNEASRLLDRAIYAELEATSQGCGGFMVYKFNYGLRLTFEPFYYSGY